MPANLSPEYKRAEAAFKAARDAKARLECLREMLRTIPKHKGTEHLQADIKTRIKQLSDELAGPKKGAGRTGPSYTVRPEGAAQVALIGAPNVGKSLLHVRLTGSHAEVGPYPFTTQLPLPGMLAHEDIHFQLLDLPPISPEHPLPWIGNALQLTDACMLVVDLSEPDCVGQVQAVRRQLRDKRVVLLEHWTEESPAGAEEHDAEALDDPFAIRLPTLLLVNKADLVAALDEELEVFHELLGVRYPALCVSAETGEGLSRIGPWLFEALHVVRVYTKVPGRPPDRDRPFTVRHGGTVQDVAILVHRDFGDTLKYARLWGGGQFKGQQVGRDHVVRDGDVLELHA